MSEQVSDAMFKRLRALGYTGGVADMLSEYLADHGVATKRELYAANGFTRGHINDFAAGFWPTAPAPAAN